MSVALNSVLFIITAVVGLLVNYYMTKKEVQQ
jgi:hypothetical protein